MSSTNRDCNVCGGINAVVSVRGPATCRSCQRAKIQQRYRHWYEKNKEAVRQYKRELMRRARQNKPELYAAHSRKAKSKFKEALFQMYGKVCILCSFTDKRALTIDHVRNNGAKERKLLGQGGWYRKALAQYRPDEYRVLCMNCQFITRIEAGRQNQY